MWIARLILFCRLDSGAKGDEDADDDDDAVPDLVENFEAVSAEVSKESCSVGLH